MNQPEVIKCIKLVKNLSKTLCMWPQFNAHNCKKSVSDYEKMMQIFTVGIQEHLSMLMSISLFWLQEMTVTVMIPSAKRLL